jgi:hypothetical protein
MQWTDKRPGVPMLELRPNRCKFAVSPHTQRHHLFCGDPTRPGEAYCPHHMRAAHYKAVRVRRLAPEAKP